MGLGAVLTGPDGTVQHGGLDPDFSGDEIWQARRDQLVAAVHKTLGEAPIEWEFRYLAGRADRALTHLARAVDAAKRAELGRCRVVR